jgi:hypothetical protein
LLQNTAQLVLLLRRPVPDFIHQLGKCRRHGRMLTVSDGLGNGPFAHRKAGSQSYCSSARISSRSFAASS